MCDLCLLLDYSWTVHDDLCGSDHLPIFIYHTIKKKTAKKTPKNHQHLNYNKANWDFFSVNVLREIDEEKVLQSEDPAEFFSNIIIKCAKESIPTSSSKPQMPKTPWFNAEWQEANKARKKAQCQVFKHPTVASIRAHQQLRAKCRLTYKTAKRELLRNFCSLHIPKTSKKKVWKIIKIIKGKDTCPSMHHLSLRLHHHRKKDNFKSASLYHRKDFLFVHQIRQLFKQETARG